MNSHLRTKQIRDSQRKAPDSRLPYPPLCFWESDLGHGHGHFLPWGKNERRQFPVNLTSCSPAAANMSLGRIFLNLTSTFQSPTRHSGLLVLCRLQDSEPRGRKKERTPVSDQSDACLASWFPGWSLEASLRRLTPDPCFCSGAVSTTSRCLHSWLDYLTALTSYTLIFPLHKNSSDGKETGY